MKNPDPMEGLLEDLVARQADELEAQGKLLLPRKSYIAREKAQLQQAIEEENKKTANLVIRANQLIREAFQGLPPEKREQYEQELNTSLFFLVDVTSKQVLENPSWQKILHLSDEFLAFIYQIGYDSLTQKKHEDALAIFQLLLLFNATIYDFWIALGTTQRILSLLQDALTSFAMAAALNPEDPHPREQTVELCLRLELFETASQEADVLEALLESQGAPKDNLLLLRDRIKNKKAL